MNDDEVMIITEDSPAIRRTVVTINDWDGNSGTTLREMDLLYHDEEVMVMRDVETRKLVSAHPSMRPRLFSPTADPSRLSGPSG